MSNNTPISEDTQFYIVISGNEMKLSKEIRSFADAGDQDFDKKNISYNVDGTYSFVSVDEVFPIKLDVAKRLVKRYYFAKANDTLVSVQLSSLFHKALTRIMIHPTGVITSSKGGQMVVQFSRPANVFKRICVSYDGTVYHLFFEGLETERPFRYRNVNTNHHNEICSFIESHPNCTYIDICNGLHRQKDYILPRLNELVGKRIYVCGISYNEETHRPISSYRSKGASTKQELY